MPAEEAGVPLACAPLKAVVEDRDIFDEEDACIEIECEELFEEEEVVECEPVTGILLDLMLDVFEAGLDDAERC